jgi:hypothetical protein
MRVAQHEAAHIVIGDAYGFHLGYVSSRPAGDYQGFAIITETAETAAVPPATGSNAFKRRAYNTDIRNAVLYAWLAMPVRSNWRDLLWEMRRLQEVAREMVLAHHWAIDELAIEIEAAGGVFAGVEVKAALEQIGHRQDEEVFMLILDSDAVSIRSADLNSLARVYVAAKRLASMSGLPMRMHHRWWHMASRVRGESERRGIEMQRLEQVGEAQTAMVDRMIAEAVIGGRSAGYREVA